MVEVNNPYLEQQRKLVIEVETNPTEENKQKLFEISEKSRAWTQARLAELHSGIQIVDDKQKELKLDKSKYPSLSKQYKEACNLYKEIVSLTKESRDLKKAIREEMDIKRKKKDEKTNQQ